MSLFFFLIMELLSAVCWRFLIYPPCLLTSLSYFLTLFFLFSLLTRLLEIFHSLVFSIITTLWFCSILCLSRLSSFVFVSMTIISTSRFLIFLYAPVLFYSLWYLIHNLLFLFYERIPSFVSSRILSLPISKSFSNDFLLSFSLEISSPIYWIC